MLRLHRFFIALLLLFGFSHPVSAAQGSPGGAGAQLEVTVKEAIAASRQLAKTLMPSAKDLGDGWKYPWELPEPARRKAPSEDAYWELATEKLPATGLDPEQAAIAVDLSANAISQAGASEGLSRRDAVMLMWHNTRQHNIPFAQRLLEGLNLTAVVYRERTRLGENAQTGETAERQLIDRVLQPYRSFDDATLERMAAQEISLVRRRIPMTYFKSNDWPGLIESRLDDEEMVEKGIWLAVVEIELMLLDPNPLTWPPDLTEQNANKMQQRTLALFRELLLAETNRRRQELVDDTAERVAEIEERLRSETDEKRREQLLAQRRRIEEEFEKEQKKLLESSQRVTQGLDVRIYMRDFGEHCHVFKLSGVSPDAVGLEASAYSAWLRNGRAVARISVGGNLNEATMTEIMDQVLSEMDARTAAYAGM